MYVMESYMLNRVFTKRLCVRDRERCAGLEVGRGQLRLSKCACVTCDRARDGRIERDGCCVTAAPLSHTHTHTSTNRRPFSHVYTTYRHLSMSHSCMIICTFTHLYVSITLTSSPHCPSATTHIWTHTHVLYQSHTQNKY